MRAITKGREPGSLTKHRRTAHCDYDNYASDEKQKLREALVQEQRGLCCYCMGSVRADPDSMKIEHWRCQEDYPALQLDYSNLLGACLGGEGQPGDMQHCDTRKGSKELKFNPADPAHRIEQRIQYGMDGTITSNDPEFDTHLNEVLNLNLSLLKNRRKGVVDGLTGWLREFRRQHHRGPDNSTLQRKRDRWTPANGALEPYARVAVWWLDQRLAGSAP